MKAWLLSQFRNFFVQIEKLGKKIDEKNVCPNFHENFIILLESWSSSMSTIPSTLPMKRIWNLTMNNKVNKNHQSCWASQTLRLTLWKATQHCHWAAHSWTVHHEKANTVIFTIWFLLFWFLNFEKMTYSINIRFFSISTQMTFTESKNWSSLRVHTVIKCMPALVTCSMVTSMICSWICWPKRVLPTNLCTKSANWPHSTSNRCL